MYFRKAENKTKHVQNCSYLTLIWAPGLSMLYLSQRLLVWVLAGILFLFLGNVCWRKDLTFLTRTSLLKELKTSWDWKSTKVQLNVSGFNFLNKGIARYCLLLNINIIVLAIQNWPGDKVTHLQQQHEDSLSESSGWPSSVYSLSCCNNNWGLKLSQKKTKARGRYSSLAHSKAQDSSPSSRIWACTQCCKIPAAFTCPAQPAGGHTGNFWPRLCCFQSWAGQLLRGLWAAESQRWHFCTEEANT